jgi:hypothetical protein
MYWQRYRFAKTILNLSVDLHSVQSKAGSPGNPESLCQTILSGTGGVF